MYVFMRTTTFLKQKTSSHKHKTNLHDEKMWVVNIEANRAEQVLYPGVIGIDPIDEVLVSATNYHLEEGRRNM